MTGCLPTAQLGDRERINTLAKQCRGEAVPAAMKGQWLNLARLMVAQDHLNDIEQACKRGAHKLWTLGNHDARFELMIASSAPQYRGVKGVHLSDHFGSWQKAMSCFINEGVEGGATMVKHIPKGGGITASRNTTLNGGVSTVNGHLHSQNVRPLSDYNRLIVTGWILGWWLIKSIARSLMCRMRLWIGALALRF
jgi:hypothetical protein